MVHNRMYEMKSSSRRGAYPRYTWPSPLLYSSEGEQTEMLCARIPDPLREEVTAVRELMDSC